MEVMATPEGAAQLANDILVWVGFGTIVGLIAKAIMPGRDPGGAVVTLLMGIGGSVIGCGVLAYFWHEKRVTPISPVGFVVAVVGAFALLAFYRLLNGTLPLTRRAVTRTSYAYQRPLRSRLRRPSTVVEEVIDE